MNVLIGSVIAMIVSAAVAAVTVVSLVGGQTDGPDSSPSDAGQQQLVEYGSTDG